MAPEVGSLAEVAQHPLRRPENLRIVRVGLEEAQRFVEDADLAR